MGFVRSEGILAVVTKVAERDPDAAVELVRLGLFEALSDQIDAYRPELEADAVALIDSRVGKARAALLRTHVGKALSDEPEPDDLAYAEGLAVLEEYVEKSLSGALLNMFNRRHPRDEQGRFIPIASGNRPDDAGEQPATRRRMTEVEAARHLQELLDQNLVRPETPVKLHYAVVDAQDGRALPGAGASTYESTVGQAEQDIRNYAVTEGGKLRLTGVSVTPKGSQGSSNPKQRAAMDALGMLTSDPAVLGMGQRFVNAAPGRGDWDSAGEQWNRSSRPGDRQGYRRMQLTGQALNAVSQPGSPAAIIGGLAQLVGDMGPEAEKVLGPGFTRAAYRYRGTERRPDKDMADAVETVNRMGAALSVENPEQRARNYALVQREAERLKGNVGAQVAAFYASGTENRDEFELGASGDVAAQVLSEGLPDFKIAQLSIASGQIPPSEGVIIDADGHVVSQAMGFKGDHYLPFDLKNLKRLRGGQYVRTRLSGGPTTEDIYTGLLTGARQIQVVSHSGVYTVQFDPDLRGGRRYSDKARKMVGRYEALLGVLAGGDQVRQDISPAEQAKLKRQAYGDANWDPEIGEQNFQSELRRRRMEASIGMDEEEMEQQATEEAKADPEWARASRSQRGDIIQAKQRELRDAVGGAAYRMFRLDGPGYDAALKALKQEFPYFIKDVKWEPLPDFRMDRGLPRGDAPRFGPKDPGYVGPDKLTPFDSGRRGPAREGTETEETPAQAGGASRPATGAPRGAQPAASEQPAQTITDLLSPKSKYGSELAVQTMNAFLPLASIAVANEMDESYSEDVARRGNPVAYAKWQMGRHGDNPDKFVDWLLTRATPDDREQIARAAEQLTSDIHEMPRVAGVDPEAWEQAAGELTELMSVLDPYDSTPDNNKIDAKPATRNPRPIAYADIVTLTSPKTLDDFVAQATHQDKLLAGHLEAAVKDPHAMPGKIRTLIDEYHKDTNNKQAEANLIAAQRAWSFAVQSDTIKALEDLNVLEGDAAPFAQRPEGDRKEPTEKSHRTSVSGSRRGRLQPMFPTVDSATQDLVAKFLSDLRDSHPA